VRFFSVKKNPHRPWGLYSALFKVYRLLYARGKAAETSS